MSSKRTFRTEHGLDQTNQNQTVPKSAEALQAESLAADMDEIIYFDPNDTGLTLEEWLIKFTPSTVHREDGIGWIVVVGKDNDVEENRDVVGLQKAWNKLVESKAPITYDMIKEIALAYNVTSGKWLFHVQTGAKVDKLWRKIATNIVENNLDGFSFSAKVSPSNSEQPTHVICIYNHNYTNDEEVFLLEKSIRAAGVKCVLHYKPDVFTYCGIYRRNQWKLRPTIFVSDYDVKEKQSRIRSNDETLVCTNSFEM